MNVYIVRTKLTQLFTVYWNVRRQVELWLRPHLKQNINISDKVKVFGVTEKNQYIFLINVHYHHKINDLPKKSGGS